MNAFIKLGVIEPLAQVLYQQGIRIPTVIQQASIPAIFKGKLLVNLDYLFRSSYMSV